MAATRATRPASTYEAIGLISGDEAVRMTVRESKDSVYQYQLNLNNLLDVAINILPDDAYALLMLVDHDLYEDDEDHFCCGRAYGGSRVAVVSTARYNSVLESQQDVETEHAWPCSHCKAYVDACCSGDSTTTPAKINKQKSAADMVPETAMAAAVASLTAQDIPSSLEDNSKYRLTNLWLGRICKTASHELGHCFGMDHCVYYACIMRGTAGLTEDAR